MTDVKINAQTIGQGFYRSRGAKMERVSGRIPITLASLLLVSICGTSQVASSAASEPSQSTTHLLRAETNSAAKTFVAAYDALVTAAFKAAVMENSPNARTKRKGIVAEIAARRRFDAVTQSLPIPSSARHYLLKVVASDHLITVDLGHLESKGKGIVNGDPLNFYIAVAAFAKYLGVETETWPPVTPAGPTAGD